MGDADVDGAAHGCVGLEVIVSDGTRARKERACFTKRISLGGGDREDRTYSISVFRFLGLTLSVEGNSCMDLWR